MEAQNKTVDYHIKKWDVFFEKKTLEYNYKREEDLMYNLYQIIKMQNAQIEALRFEVDALNKEMEKCAKRY